MLAVVTFGGIDLKVDRLKFDGTRLLSAELWQI